MNINKKLAVTISSVACLLTTMGAGSAAAATFNFSYSGSSVLNPSDTITASGVFTTAPYDPATHSYKITSITGTRNGTPIESLLSPESLFDNDNLLFINAPVTDEYGSSLLDEYGLAYTAGGQSYNVFHTYAYIELSSVGPFVGGYQVTSFSATPASVPEPSSVLGILGISVFTGGTLLKRKLKAQVKAQSICDQALKSTLCLRPTSNRTANSPDVQSLV